jgi:hypothetical protein
MRALLRDRLPPVPHRRFLVYLMGPYKSFELADLVDDEGSYSEQDVLDLLETVRDRLRDEGGLNAFLAIDVDIPLDEMDAATQTIEFATASNVIVFVVPAVGKNLGVGIETGSVLEGLPDEKQERIVFVHEKNVRSAMIASLSRRWDVAVYSYRDVDELVKRIREFAVDVMNREATGDLPLLDED